MRFRYIVFYECAFQENGCITGYGVGNIRITSRTPIWSMDAVRAVEEVINRASEGTTKAKVTGWKWLPLSGLLDGEIIEEGE